MICVIFGGLEMLMQTIYFVRKKNNYVVMQRRLDYLKSSNSLQEVIIISMRFLVALSTDHSLNFISLSKNRNYIHGYRF